MKIIDNATHKIIVSDDFNMVFSKESGFTAMWGKNKDEDPEYSKYGNVILDIEITTNCLGVLNKEGTRSVCNFCYKGNKPTGGRNMTLETFKKILDKMPKVLTQIAIGADSLGTTNPDLFPMMEYSRSKGIIPNLTIAEVSDDIALQLKKYCGAVAISRYANKDVCYDSIKKLTDLGMTQVNIHQILHSGNFDQVMETLQDRLSDSRLSKMNAIVFLSLKKKGRGVGFNPMPFDQFKKIVDFALENKISIGFDSCGCHRFLKAVEGHKDYEQFKMMSEPCESVLMSAFINVDGMFSACSFCDGVGDWREGIDVVNCGDFVKDVWENKKTQKFRTELLVNGRKCFYFDVDGEKQ